MGSRARGATSGRSRSPPRTSSSCASSSCSWATKEALAPEPAEELVLAVHEVATNSVRHGGGVGMLRLWRTSDTLVCEVQDAGHIRDPLTARRRPGGEARESRGLWIADQICDLVEIASSPRGSQVRIHKRLD